MDLETVGTAVAPAGAAVAVGIVGMLAATWAIRPLESDALLFVGGWLAFGAFAVATWTGGVAVVRRTGRERTIALLSSVAAASGLVGLAIGSSLIAFVDGATVDGSGLAVLYVLGGFLVGLTGGTLLLLTLPVAVGYWLRVVATS